MRLSHSKLSLLINNPMEYYLSYRMGIYPKVTKQALYVGSAVHWGIEHDTEDLTDYFGKDGYGRDQLMSEAMVHGYHAYKDQIFDELLTKEDGSKLTLVDETHELYVEGKLKSFKYVEPHLFVGIIDLLLTTNEGFIVVDYKTSTNVPNWDDYLDQLYRYIFLLNSAFPEFPVLKIAVINLRKVKTKQTRGETDASFKHRMEIEYEANSDSLVNWHIFDPKDLNQEFLKLYIDNLSRTADAGQLIDENNMWYINFGATNSYGGSSYKDIIYHVPDCYVLYSIKDEIWDKYEKEVKQMRDCKPIDMLVIDRPDVLNKYEIFEANASNLTNESLATDKEGFFAYLKDNYVCDNELLDEYYETYCIKHGIKFYSKSIYF